MNIAIYFNVRRSQGGLYQYAQTLLNCLQLYGGRHHYTIFDATLDTLKLTLTVPHMQLVRLSRHGVLLRSLIEMALMISSRIGIDLKGPMPRCRKIDEMRPSLVLYVKPTLYTFLWPYPAVFPIHDLEHRLQPQFSEVSALGEYRRREYIYRNSVPISRGILTDSETGRADVISSYNADPEHVFTLPFLPSPAIDCEGMPADKETVTRRYGLPKGFLFYPAAFWHHKNHVQIVNALSQIRKQYGIAVPLVLVGEKKEGYQHLVNLVNELGLTDHIYFLGYVPDEVMPALYASALALIMPTFFGPTNIPVLEAWRLGCPVITSDIRGIREQVGDAGLLVDPTSTESVASAIWRVYQYPALRSQLSETGFVRLAKWRPQDFTQKLEDILAIAGSNVTI